MADYSSDMAEIPEDERDGRTVDADGVIIDDNGDTATVFLDGEESEEGDAEFDANLAESMEKQDRQRLADKLIAAVDADEEARSEWKQRLDKGLELLGLKDRPEDDEPFPGASSVTHPLIGEAIVQFQARALPEVVPSSGPVKCTTVGDQTEAKDQQAERVSEYLNWRLMVDDEEWFDDTDQLLFYLPFGGSAFRKLFTDPVTGRAKARYVKAEDFIVPYKAKSLADAQRYTHSFEMHANDIERAMANGTYVTVDLDTGREPGENDKLEDTADMRSQSVSEDDSTHRIYEIHCYQDLDVDPYQQDFDLPYIITVDKDQGDVLSIRRNWDEDDEDYEKLVWFSHYKFLPGFGFYGFGFLHMIGGLAEATTGTVRALLDSAARSNLQAGFKSKEARKISGDDPLANGEFRDVDLPGEDLQKAFYPLPFKEPSNALFNLLGILTDAGQRFSSTTETMVGDGNQNAPVGTTVAMIEQGSKVFSAVHRRLHRAAGREYRLFAKLDAENLDDEPYPYQVSGQTRYIRAADFDDTIDVVPVSDPNIFSHTQRIALAQAVVQLVNGSPDVYGIKEKRRAHERLLEAMRVPDADELLPSTGAQRRDPVTENQYMMTGHPVTAFPDQDHAAHIKIHEAMAAQYANAAGPAAQKMQAELQAHVAEHHAYAYRQQIEQSLGVTLPAGLHPNMDGHEKPLPIDEENLIARLVAQNTQPVPSPAQQQAHAAQAQLQAEQQRKQAEFEAEQRRKDQEHQAKMQREREAFMAKQQREAADWQRGEREDAADWAAGEQRDQAEWSAEQQREQAAWEAEQARKAAEARDATRQRGADLALDNIDRAFDAPDNPQE
ncbi:hypothetical protein [Salinisphaera hydrothermalis]|uniref:Uncharacterized protein n=1 Tax=Salinisphaera hydrothermalis (strain C41B8) TaxID=1304275 RepID=A0A084INN8_SALHC|nr:hypothetical protein [Salinisphaera hydrothermalis]KEZ78322.1 hypothetical protein C41B8_05453 [Salinisphaera hydrothermalis C41B8]